MFPVRKSKTAISIKSSNRRPSLYGCISFTFIIISEQCHEKTNDIEKRKESENLFYFMVAILFTSILFDSMHLAWRILIDFHSIDVLLWQTVNKIEFRSYQIRLNA